MYNSYFFFWFKILYLKINTYDASNKQINIIHIRGSVMINNVNLAKLSNFNRTKKIT